jgi:hypothetical protein
VSANPTNFHIEKVANGYIVTEASPYRDLSAMKASSTYAYASSPPHVFETFSGMAAWLSSVLEEKKSEDAQ